jgi:hypothetical protein
MIVAKDGTQIWRKDGKLHRDEKDDSGNLLPAVIKPNGDKYFWIDGKNMNDPNKKSGLVVKPNGTKTWYRNGVKHRDEIDPITGEDLPALIETNGSMYWYRDGKLHRETFLPEKNCFLPAFIHDTNGTKVWYRNGVKHSYTSPLTGEDFPAEISHDGETWYSNGQIHRERYIPETDSFAPAVITKYCMKCETYKNGKLHSYTSPVTGKAYPAVFYKIIPNDEDHEDYLYDDNSWYRDGLLHRDEKDENGMMLPAVICRSHIAWYRDGKLHREEIDPKFNEYLPAKIMYYWGGADCPHIYWMKNDDTCNFISPTSHSEFPALLCSRDNRVCFRIPKENGYWRETKQFDEYRSYYIYLTEKANKYREMK